MGGVRVRIFQKPKKDLASTPGGFERAGGAGGKIQKILEQIKQVNAKDYDINSVRDYALRLELLYYLGVLRGNVFYPCIGDDYLPSYFATVFGIDVITGEARLEGEEAVGIAIARRLPKSYRKRTKTHHIFTSNIFSYESYFPEIFKLNVSGVDVLFIKGLTHWVGFYGLFPGSDEEINYGPELYKSICNFIREISNGLLKEKGFIVIADNEDLWLADFIKFELGYKDLLAKREYESIREALSHIKISRTRFSVDTDTIVGRVPIRVFQKPVLNLGADGHYSRSIGARSIVPEETSLTLTDEGGSRRIEAAHIRPLSVYLRAAQEITKDPEQQREIALAWQAIGATAWTELGNKVVINTVVSKYLAQYGIVISEKEDILHEQFEWLLMKGEYSGLLTHKDLVDNLKDNLKLELIVRLGPKLRLREMDILASFRQLYDKYYGQAIKGHRFNENPVFALRHLLAEAFDGGELPEELADVAKSLLKSVNRAIDMFGHVLPHFPERILWRGEEFPERIVLIGEDDPRTDPAKLGIKQAEGIIRKIRRENKESKPEPLNRKEIGGSDSEIGGISWRALGILVGLGIGLSVLGIGFGALDWSMPVAGLGTLGLAFGLGIVAFNKDEGGGGRDVAPKETSPTLDPKASRFTVTGKEKSISEGFYKSAERYLRRNKLLQSAPSFTEPLAAINWLRKNKARLDNNSLSYLIRCLWIGGKIPKNKLHWQFLAAAADYYDKSKLLQSEPSFKKPLEAINWLRKNKARLDNKSLDYLISCLWTGGKIPGHKLKKWEFMAAAAEYALKNERLIKEEIRLAREKLDRKTKKRIRERPLRIIRYIDRGKFTYLRDESKSEEEESYFLYIFSFGYAFWNRFLFPKGENNKSIFTSSRFFQTAI
jgi:hypothetical protein